MSKIRLNDILDSINDFFFPRICEGCGSVGAYICDECMRIKFKFVDVQRCHVCKKKVHKGVAHDKCGGKTRLDGVFIISKYSKFIEDYIGDIKYEFYYAMIDDLVKVMNFALKKNIDFKRIVKSSAITFVPLHKKRKRWRGFNQSEEMAKKIADFWNCPCLKLLNRVKNTKCQVGLDKKERLNNLDNSIKIVQGTDVKTSSIIVVDDVMTTGNTLEECAKVLKSKGFKKIYGLIFARG